MGIVQKADEWWMSNVIERIAWTIEDRFGICNIELSRLCYMAALGTVPLIGFVTNSMPVVIYGCVCGPIAMITMTPFFASMKGHPRHVRNSMRDEWLVRIVLTSIVIVLFAIGAKASEAYGVEPLSGMVTSLLLAGLGTLGFIYFLMCERMPPGYSEEKKRLALSPA